ncbi:MAG: geranylgeranyl reductase family protein [Acidimicrobiales bacterium]|nr:geranylgeranyl reductase family protein [Acidimicrobiales bacterium]
MLTADVAVVGGGPAGAAAAITLARAGRHVVLVDRARFPRDKCCGDGLTVAALRLLEQLGLDPGMIPSWTPIAEACIRAPSGRIAAFPLPRDLGLFAAVAPRIELDAALLDLARGEGVKVADGHALTAARVEPDRIVLEVAGLGAVGARYAVGADGIWSPLRRALGAGVEGYRGEWHAFRQYVTNTGPEARRLWVWYEPDLLPGFAWSFPLPDGRANVGFGIQRGGRWRTRDMAALWPDLLGRAHVRAVLGADAVLDGTHKAWPIPARVEGVPLTAAGGRALFVGDAAAATDPLTGEGIGQALLTGALAARAIAEAGALRPARAAATYEGRVRGALAADHRLSTVVVRLLAHRRGAEGAIRLAALTPWTRRRFARWLFEDEPRALAVTPSRWHRHVLRGPGAYRR